MLASERSERNFFAALFDRSFRTFVTPAIVSTIFVIGVVAIGLWSLLFFASGFVGYGPFGGPSAFGIYMHAVGAVVIFFVAIIVLRVQLEFAMAVFRIAENTTPKG